MSRGGFPNASLLLSRQARRTDRVDREGDELAGIAEAAEAARRGREIAVRDALNAVPRSAGVIVIDEGWRTVLELPF